MSLRLFPNLKPLPLISPLNPKRDSPYPIQVYPSEYTGPHRIHRPWNLAQPLKPSLCSLFNLSFFYGF